METQFLASIMPYPEKVALLDKEVTSLDFINPLYYDIYSTIMTNYLNNKKLPYPDLKFLYKDNLLALNIICDMESSEVITDLSKIYTKLINQSQKERLEFLSEKITNYCKEDELSADEIANKAQTELIRITKSSATKIKTLNDMESSFLNTLSERVSYYYNSGSIKIELPTGIKDLDSITSGLQKKNTWVLGAATSDGKTQLAVQISNSIIDNDHGVLYCLLEDAAENLISRFLSYRTGIKLFDIKCGKLNSSSLNRIREEYGILKQMNKLFIEDGMSKIDDLCQAVKFAKLKNKIIDVVVIDYIGQTTDSGHGNREQEVAAVSSKLVNLAKEMDIAILVLSQVNTNPDNRGKGLPLRMNDIRDSKAVGHDCSVGLFIHLPDKYDVDKNFSRKNVHLIIAKNRYGETHKIIKLKNKAEVARFEEI